MEHFMNEEVRKEIRGKSEKIISKLNYNNDGMVSTDSIIKAVSEETNTDISFSYASFEKLKVPSGFDIGAMMCVQNEKDSNGRRKATIILNSDKPVKFRRFSLVHELGHLVNDKYTISKDGKVYTLSAHIQYNIFSFTDEQCAADRVIESEQQANIFALHVLMPSKAFKAQVLSSDSFSEVADYFGVDEDAVRSRALLGL